jgi:ATP/ADP translocase
MLPAATASLRYIQPSTTPGARKLFYELYSFILSLSGLFDLFIYPNADYLHPSLETVQANYSGGAKTSGMAVLASIATHWTSALFTSWLKSFPVSSVCSFAILPRCRLGGSSQRFYPLCANEWNVTSVAGQYSRCEIYQYDREL